MVYHNNVRLTKKFTYLFTIDLSIKQLGILESA